MGRLNSRKRGSNTKNANALTKQTQPFIIIANEMPGVPATYPVSRLPKGAMPRKAIVKILRQDNIVGKLPTMLAVQHVSKMIRIVKKWNA